MKVTSACLLPSPLFDTAMIDVFILGIIAQLRFVFYLKAVSVLNMRGIFRCDEICMFIAGKWKLYLHGGVRHSTVPRLAFLSPLSQQKEDYCK